MKKKRLKKAKNGRKHGFGLQKQDSNYGSVSQPRVHEQIYINGGCSTKLEGNQWNRRIQEGNKVGREPQSEKVKKC